MPKSTSSALTRRALLAAGAATLASPWIAGGAMAQARFPSRNMRVVIPTGQGGGADRLARTFDDAWGPLLGNTRFEYSFHAGAAGQVGYELFVKRRDRDGHNLLFGNIGPEMIMYTLQRPDFRFPEDFFYFSSLDVDDSCLFVRRDSPIRNLQDLVEQGRRRPLNTATSRIPHPASIGALALGDATRSRFNLIPYGGGNPTLIAVLNREADVGVLPIAGVVALPQQYRVLGVFNREKNVLAAQSENAPTVNSVFGLDLPDLYSSRAWAIHTSWAEANPTQFKILEDTSRQAHASPLFREAFVKTGQPAELLSYGDRASCTRYANAMVELARRYQRELSAAN
jgi:tripartite-type tricarboxylate transporter receptor subunit TctC